ncbi:MAG TPA: hypothetical protein PK511_10530 [Chitinophagales bacterium]|nr:hypothetical protein [Chitinophagales bacterium]HMU69417.1 hypothetical protein [Chitinophagales bacterium]HMZ89710.1 hypothetical protein [Chitinophagales bacterium]HNA57374.1 hypothetical protein [Chitinophagales bacterium]HNE46988.1 hypothetical protein [Chitinophagales bacterium]
MKNLQHIPNITPQLNAVRARLQHTQDLIQARAAAHVLHPNEYPLPADGNSLEHHFVEVYQLLSDKGKKNFEENAKLIMGYMTADRRAELGDLANLNHKSPLSTVEQVKQLGTNDTMRIKQEHVTANETLLRKHLPKSFPGIAFEGPLREVDVRGQNPRTLSFFVDSIHCEKTTDLRKDEISLFGFTFDAFGQGTKVEQFEVGKFKKGETIALGSKAKLRDFDLRAPGFFPQSFFTNLFLFERDWVNFEKTGKRLMMLGAALSATFLTVGFYLLTLSPIPVLGTALGIASIACLLMTAISYGFALLIGAMCEDVSGGAGTAFTFNIPPVIPVGTAFTETLDFTIEGGLFGVHKAKYSAQVRWERTA